MRLFPFERKFLIGQYGEEEYQRVVEIISSLLYLISGRNIQEKAKIPEGPRVVFGILTGGRLSGISKLN